ncbi:hypothetical protein GOODEAATRI_001844 [Goodea atripinnis]|uniref:Uncharacterized protein n=1 Tax=Goodea atripinnis TaxID=208336 RepID=A0ABV0P0Z3_9TELE
MGLHQQSGGGNRGIMKTVWLSYQDTGCSGRLAPAGGSKMKGSRDLKGKSMRNNKIKSVTQSRVAKYTEKSTIKHKVFTFTCMVCVLFLNIFFWAWKAWLQIP